MTARQQFGNLLGSRGSVLTTFRRQVEAGGLITVTDPEVTRYFMTIQEAVKLLSQAGAIGDNGVVLILDMGEPVRIADVAHQMASLAPRPGCGVAPLVIDAPSGSTWSCAVAEYPLGCVSEYPSEATKPSSVNEITHHFRCRRTAM